MTSLSQTDVVVLLTARFSRDPSRSPLTPKEFWSTRRRVGDLSRFLEQPAAGIGALLGGDVALASRIAQLLQGESAFRREQEQLTEEGLTYVSTVEPTFPTRLGQRLGDSCPPLLLIAGRADLLSEGGVGVVGSRNVGEAGAEVARIAGMTAASRQRPLVSGAAKGVDSLATGVALASGGTAISVPSEGLRKVLKRRTTDLGVSLYLSPFGPDAPFSAGNAMARNKIIYALADITLVVASDDAKGGTWQGATEALRRRFGSVAVWRGKGEGPGNSGIERLGARRVTAVTELFDEPDPAPAQLGLDLV